MIAMLEVLDKRLRDSSGIISHGEFKNEMKKSWYEIRILLLFHASSLAETHSNLTLAEIKGLNSNKV